MAQPHGRDGIAAEPPTATAEEPASEPGRAHKERRRDRERERDRERDYDRRDRYYERRDRHYDRSPRHYDRRRDRRRSRSRSASPSRRSNRSKSRSPSPVDPAERERRRQQEEIEDLTKDQRTVFVSQLVMKAHERDVKKFFEKVGKVKQVIMIRDKYTNRHKGFAYVEMKDLETIPLVLMLNGTVPDFQKFPIFLKASEAEKNFLDKQEKAATRANAEPAPDGGPIVQNRLYVGNLHEQISEEDLSTVLQHFGEVQHILLHRNEHGVSRGYAFVTFVKAEDASYALQKIGGVGLEVMGRRIKVGFLNDSGNNPASHAGELGGLPGGDMGGAGGPGNWRLDDDGGNGLQMSANERGALMARLGQGAGLAPHPGAMPPQVAPGMMADPSGAVAAAKALAAQTAGSLAVNGGGPGMPGTGMPPGMPPGAMPPGVPPAMPGAPAPSMPMPMPPASNMPPTAGPIQGMPSFTFVVRNMFDPATETEPGWDQDIKEDVEGECSKYGAVLHSHVETTQPGGLVYLLFSSQDTAVRAAHSLHGRWFAGRMITCEFLNPDMYAVQFPQAAQDIMTARATAANAAPGL